MFADKGFTLIELVIVISIISLIGAVTAPSIINYQEMQAFERFSNQLENEIKNAQIDSMTKDTSIRVRYNLSEKKVSFCQGVGFTNCSDLVHPSTISSFKIFSGDISITEFFINSYGNTSLTDLSTTFVDLRIETKYSTSTKNLNLNRFGGIKR